MGSAIGCGRKWKGGSEIPNVEREVWIILGATLSKRGWEQELRKNDPAPEAIQTTHLIQSTLASIGGANSRLRILCSP